MEVFVIIVVLAFMLAASEAKGKRQRAAQAYDFNPVTVHGTARFADTKDLKRAGYLKSGGVRIGFTPDGKKPLFYNGMGHMLLIAAARTGKAFTILVTAILSLGRSRSLVVFDPKAELCCITAHARQRHGEVIVINPFGIWLDRMRGLKQGTFNSMDICDPSRTDYHAKCEKLAESFRPDNVGNDPHFWDTAKDAISGTIAALKKYGQPEDQNLVAMRNVITGASGRSFFEFCRECLKLGDPFINQKLARFAAPGAEESKEFASVLSTVSTRTSWIGNEATASIMKDSNFSFRDLKRKPGMTIYICLPLNTMDVSHPLFADMLMCLLSELLDEGITGPSVLMIVDEAAQIPWFKAWQDALGMAAGAAGLQMWLVYQDFSAILNQFNKAAHTVVQNSGVTMAFGARDEVTRETISKLAGITEVITRSHSVSMDRRTGEPNINDSASQVSRPLMNPDEVGRLRDDEMLVMAEGVPGVIKAKRRPYLIDCSGYRPNPYFKKQGWFQ